MERFERLETAEDYILEHDKEDNQVNLHITNRWIRLKLKTPMLYTHDGNLWIKTSGGRAITTDQLKTIFHIPEETIQKIKQLLKPKCTLPKTWFKDAKLCPHGYAEHRTENPSPEWCSGCEYFQKAKP